MPAPFGYYLVCATAAVDRSKVQRFKTWMLQQAKEEVSRLIAQN